jgi:hypothetical protein
MTRISLHRVATIGVVALLAALAPAAAAGASPRKVHAAQAGPPGLPTVATGLNNPRHLRFGPDGALYVAEAGSGGPTTPGPCATDPVTNSPACVGGTGSITKIAGGQQSRVLTGLPSVAGSDGSGASGPAAVLFDGSNLKVVTQDAAVSPDGTNPFGSSGRLLGRLITAAPGSASGTWTGGPDFGAYEAANNPDHGAGPGAMFGDPPIDSDP